MLGLFVRLGREPSNFDIDAKSHSLQLVLVELADSDPLTVVVNVHDPPWTDCSGSRTFTHGGIGGGRQSS